MDNKVVFLDRDGVINKYPGDTSYVTSLKEFRFLPKVKAALKLLKQNGWRVFVISNQAGVGKGYFSQQALDDITAHMTREVRSAGGEIHASYYCVHRPDEGCRCRKPLPGLLHRAAREHGVSLRGAYFIGDTLRDIEAARAAGCASILVLSGKERFANRKAWNPRPDFVFKNLHAAVVFITREFRGMSACAPGRLAAHRPSGQAHSAGT
jgi:histidinol-phosphate phosphatase family protein